MKDAIPESASPSKANLKGLKWAAFACVLAASLVSACSSSSTAAVATTVPSLVTSVPATTFMGSSSGAPTTRGTGYPTPRVQTSQATAAAKVMPNVVCMTLKDAQAKFRLLGAVVTSKDVTGQGRSQLVDSNWVVVTQTPKSGAALTTTGAVLNVAKKGEPGYCGVLKGVAKPHPTATVTTPAPPTKAAPKPAPTHAAPKPLAPVPRPTTKAPTATSAPSTTTQAPPPTTLKPTTSSEVSYKNCTEAKAAGAAPIHEGEPGYAPRLDRDGDGIACDK